jgi:outer membrane murein-binding lipoprotein Lpp
VGIVTKEVDKGDTSDDTSTDGIGATIVGMQSDIGQLKGKTAELETDLGQFKADVQSANYINKEVNNLTYYYTKN